MIDQIIAFNKTFVEQKGYEKYLTSKYPDKKLAVLESWCSPLSCMDTRLTELLPAALGLKNGDAKIIKNAGGLVISALVSSVNMLLRDEEFDTLESLCYAFSRDPKEIKDYLYKRGFVWSEQQKQFRPIGYDQ